MKLEDFLSTFKSKEVQVTLIDKTVTSTVTELITFKAPGYESLDDDLKNREVVEWNISNPAALKIGLGEIIP